MAQATTELDQTTVGDERTAQSNTETDVPTTDELDEQSAHEAQRAQQRADATSEAIDTANTNDPLGARDDRRETVANNSGTPSDAEETTSKGSSEVTKHEQRNGRHDRREKWFERDASDELAMANRTGEQAIEQAESHFTTEANLETSPAAPSGSAESKSVSTAANPVDAATLPDATLTRTDTIVAAASVSIDSAQVNAGGPPTPEGQANNEAVTAVQSGRRAERQGESHATANKPVTPGDSADLTQQERVRLVQRVARSFARLGPDGGQINLRLHPPQLGSLNVQVRMEGRSMTAVLTTESTAAREAILESLPVLRGRLAEQGFEISQFQVDVAANGSDASQGGNSDQHNAFQQGNSREHTQASPLVSERRNWTPPEHAMDHEHGELMWQTHTGIDIQA
ncbi:MAG: flagellar hook-length control protein FliK [Pirellulaceae bacterium]